jgi:gliding motility-associated-like protein
VDAGLDRQFCRGDTIKLGGPSVGGGTTPYNFSWSPSDSLSDGTILDPNAFPDSTTDYKITATDANGCTDSDSLTVTVHSNPSVAFTGLDSNYCSNRPGDTLFGSEAPDGDFLGNGVSDLGNGEGYFDPGTVSNDTHEVYYRYSDSNTCTDTDTQSVAVYDSPKLDDSNLLRIKATCGNSDGSIENMLVGGGKTPYTFEWRNSSGDLVDSTLDLKGAPTGNYTLTVTDDNGCYHTLGPYKIGEIGGPTADAGMDTIFCENDSARIGDTAAASDGTPPYRYHWDPGASLSDSTIPRPKASPSRTTDYILTVTDSNDCKARDTVIVGIHPAPELDAGDTIKTCKKRGARLGGEPTAQEGHPPYEYFWSNPTALSDDSIPNPEASPVDSTTYPLYVIDSLGCDSRDTAWVLIDKRHCAGPHIFVPNAFSPNNDGVNDELHVYGKDIGSFKLQIFNRWGQRVFITRSKEWGWDGKYKGKLVEPGVYVYKVSGIYENGEKFEKSGNITLLR